MSDSESESVENQSQIEKNILELVDEPEDKEYDDDKNFLDPKKVENAVRLMYSRKLKGTNKRICLVKNCAKEVSVSEILNQN